MEYRVISAQKLLSMARATETLTRRVREALALGWEPLGGVSVTKNGLVVTVTQAVVKHR